MESSTVLSHSQMLPKTSELLQSPTKCAQELQVGTVLLYGVRIVSLIIDNQERLCLAQISNTLLKQFSYNEIHNRRVALGITCVQCTPVQLEILRRAGAMPVSSRRCGMITRREAERLCKSFLGDNAPPRLPEDFAFLVHHECAWGCKGAFVPARYNSSRAKCIKCSICGLFFSPNKFIFHSHRAGPSNKYIQPDAANFNSWRRHMKLSGDPPDEIIHAWEDVKAMFNGGTRKRLLSSTHNSNSLDGDSKCIRFSHNSQVSLIGQDHVSELGTMPVIMQQRVPPFADLSIPLSNAHVIDYVWQQQQQIAVASANKSSNFSILPYLPWLNKRSTIFFPSSLSSAHSISNSMETSLPSVNNTLRPSAFHPVTHTFSSSKTISSSEIDSIESDSCEGNHSDDEVDVETTEDDVATIKTSSHLSSNSNSFISRYNSYRPLPQSWSPQSEYI